MHVLSNSFSHRRRSSKPRDLHICKISFSGCSLSSGSSDSSASSTTSSSVSAPSTAASSLSLSPPPPPPSTPRSLDPDPLALHPTFQPAMAPPPLCDRPLLAGPDRRRSDELTTFYLGGSEGGGDDDAGALGQAVAPVVESRAVEPGDYFAVQLTRRPALPRSRWSESTVATVESSLAAADDDTVRGSDDDAQEPEELDGGDVDDVIGHYYLPPAKPVDGHRSMPNFSHKRDTLPKRPPIKTLDSLEDFIKRGGWKRRGIVFHSEEMCGDTDELHLGF